MGVHLEVLQEQMTAYDAYRVVAEAQIHTIGYTYQMTGIEEYLSIHPGLVERTLHGQLTFTITLEAEQLIGNEAVDKRDRQSVQVHHQVHVLLTLRLVGTRYRSHLHTFHGQCTIHEV